MRALERADLMHEVTCSPHYIWCTFVANLPGLCAEPVQHDCLIHTKGSLCSLSKSSSDCSLRTKPRTGAALVSNKFCNPGALALGQAPSCTAQSSAFASIPVCAAVAKCQMGSHGRRHQCVHCICTPLCSPLQSMIFRCLCIDFLLFVTDIEAQPYC